MKMFAAHLFVLIGLLSCDRDYKPTFAMMAPPAARLTLNKPVGEFGMKEAVSEEKPVPSSPGEEATTERKLIKNGEIQLVVNSVKKTRTEIDGICGGLKAYISKEDQNDFGNRLQHALVIRVPSSYYDSLVSRVEALAIKVANKSTTLQDVTEEFIDVEARLRTKKGLAARYHEILKQARSVEEILSVENHIGNVQAEIESMEGRLKYLNDQISYSTLNVTYHEVVGTDFGFGSKFVGAGKEGWDNLLRFIVGLMNLWPFVILIGSGAWLFFRWRKKRKLS